jgi:hypothetical protein
MSSSKAPEEGKADRINPNAAVPDPEAAPRTITTKRSTRETEPQPYDPLQWVRPRPRNRWN